MYATWFEVQQFEISIHKTSNLIMKANQRVRKLFPLLFLIFFSSCEIEDPITIQEENILSDLKIPQGFNFKLSDIATIDLSVRLLGGEPMSFGEFDLVFNAEKVFQETENLNLIEKLATITLDKDGKFSGELNVPLVYNKLFLVSKTGGVDPVIVLNRKGSGFSVAYEPNNDLKKSAYINSFNFRMYSNPTALGSWSDVGYPFYLSENAFVSSGLLTRVRQILTPNTPIDPEFRGTPVNGSYNTVINLDLEPNQTATVDITFLFSLAGNRNSLGYYWYPTDTPPASRSQITNRRLIFPNTNTTDANDKSGMVAGETVRLVGPNENGSFPPNTTIGFFLVQSGFNKGSNGAPGTVNYSRTTFYSESRYNISPENDQRFVNIYDEQTGTIVYGVEDGGLAVSLWDTRDNDFDDVVFFASYTPDDAINLEEFPKTDPEVAPNQNDILYNPSSETFATLMFEDSWPSEGDGDYNDVVIDYRYSAIASSSDAGVVNSNKYISQINVKARVSVADASNRNGIGVMIPGISPNSVLNISPLNLDGSNSNSVSGITYQLESGHSSDVVVILTEDINSLFNAPCFNSGRSDCMTGEPIEFSFTITFNPMTRQTNFNNISTFLFLNQDRGREVHTAGRRPSVKFNTSLVGSQSDNSDLNNISGTFFKAKSTNIPWALDIPAKIPVVKNQSSILEAYPDFGQWANSQGALNINWYIEGQGRRNTSKLINRP